MRRPLNLPSASRRPDGDPTDGVQASVADVTGSLSSRGFAMVGREKQQGHASGQLSCDLGEKSRSRSAKTPCEGEKQGELGVALRYRRCTTHLP